MKILISLLLIGSNSLALDSLSTRSTKAQTELNAMLFSAGIPNSVNIGGCHGVFGHPELLTHIPTEQQRHLDHAFCLTLRVRSEHEKAQVKADLGIQEDSFVSHDFLVLIRR